MFNFEFDIRQFYVTIMVSIAGGIGFLIRKIFTSERQIELLKQELKSLQESRQNNDKDLKGQLSEMRHDIKSLLASRPYPRPKNHEE
jgi:uncharacterized membrane protein (DUF106 family)